ncbi:hypothetical protein TDB9533_01075 [Thalassocella blandensis]|nr:hypothetical protein TDB9533_01075 [Thalassocella blandensis]
MQPRHLCCSHVLLIQHDENQAFHHWQSTMNSGVQAFVQCRMEEAKNYLNAALEIAMLRFACPANQSFSALQLIKPSEFLCEIYLCEENVTNASMVLSAVNELIHTRDVPCDQCDLSVLESMETKIQNKRRMEKPKAMNNYGFASASNSLH